MNRSNRHENIRFNSEDTSDFEYDQNQRSVQNQSHSPGSFIWDNDREMDRDERNSSRANRRFRNDGYSDHFSFRSDANGPRTSGLGPYGSYRFQSADTQRDNLNHMPRSFWGKGPKGYKRSDDRIKEDVSEALFHDHMVDASELEVSVKEGVVTLSGTVSDRQTKRAAERCIENLSWVDDVRNDIRVLRHSRPQGPIQQLS